MAKRFVSVTFVAFIVIVALARAAWSQNNAADTDMLVEALKLSPGNVVGEIGAGGGELSLAIAKRVAPGGRVISSELGASRVQGLREAVGKRADNIEVIEGHESRTNFPEGCCDAVFMRNVYHHFADPPAMNATLLRAVKPGGAIAVIDFTPPGKEADVPSGRSKDKFHGLYAETLVRELTNAGFIDATAETIDKGVYMVVAKRRPAF